MSTITSSFLNRSLSEHHWDLFKKAYERDLAMHNSPLPCSLFSFGQSHPAVPASAHSHTGFYYADLTLLKLGGETAVLVWPWAHPSLVPASLHSASIPPLFQISLPPSHIVSKTTPHPFIIFAGLISASLPTCPSILTRRCTLAHLHLPTLCHQDD